MKILFQGDSITDAGRSRDDCTNLGNGYPKYTAELIRNKYPDSDIEFINLGISGNRAENLVERWQTDAIDIQPDVISILIGVNDTWHRAGDRSWMDNAYFENCYRTVLTQIKEKTNAKIIMLEQFLLYTPDKEYFRVDLDPKIQITRKLAREYADVFIPLDGIFNAETVRMKCEPTVFAADGVHPTVEGARFIAGLYLNAVSPMIDEIINR